MKFRVQSSEFQVKTLRVDWNLRALDPAQELETRNLKLGTG